MNTFIYISLALYIPFMTWFLIMAWRCKSPAFGKTELTLLGLLEITNVAVYSAWLIPLHAGWLIKLTLMCVFSCINLRVPSSRRSVIRRFRDLHGPVIALPCAQGVAQQFLNFLPLPQGQ